MNRNITDQKVQKALSALWKAKLYHHVPLTAIVVCGDQSSGKSAVLEALSGFRFPVNDGMCTRFVTRVEMVQDTTVRITATITPSTHHGPAKQDELQRWKYETKDLTEFEQVVVRAGEVMGSDSESGFLKDVLVIRISGPELSVFVFIDIPGIIQSTREGQPDSDIDYIKGLVTEHMQDPTKIILTVVAANNDLELQGVLRLAKQVIPRGERTIGVITKPDACEERPSIQESALRLLGNSGNGLYQWPLGWHIVKNRSESQRNMTTSERDEAERKYLAQPPWDKVPDQFKGAENLSARLEVQVCTLFTSGLTDLKATIKKLHEEAVIELDWAKTTVSSVASRRTVLGRCLGDINAAMIKRVTKAGQDTRDEFGNNLEDAAADLGNALRSRGHFYEVDESCSVEYTRVPTAEVQAEWDLPEPLSVDELQTFAEGVVADAKADAGQVTDDMYKKLFRKQVQHWPHILRQYINTVRDILDTQLSNVSLEIIPREIETSFNDVLVVPQVELFAERLRGRIQELLVPGKLRAKQASEATAKAWRAQHDIFDEQRLREAFGIANNTSSKAQNTKREFQAVLQALKRIDINVAGFPAKQAIAMMQLLYTVSR